jgi:hypothetical protein
MAQNSCYQVRQGRTWSRTARVEKDWTRNRRQLRKTDDFGRFYFNDSTALLGLITMEPVIRSG